MNFADWGPQDDPVYRRLALLVTTTLADVHLLTDDTAAVSMMQIREEDKRGLVYVLHGTSYTETDFTDAVMALLGTRAPSVYWYVVPMGPGQDEEDDPEPSVNVIGVYDAAMPAEAITVVT